MSSIPSLTTLNIDNPPSCIAFCPQKPELFVIGTYVLHQAEEDQQHGDKDEEEATTEEREAVQQSRTGGLMLFELRGHELILLQDLSITSAVLDIEWSPHPSQGNVLAVACSIGTIELYRFTKQNRLEQQLRWQVSEGANLVLDLVWHPTEGDTLGLTLSNGAVVLCYVDSNDSSTWSDGSPFRLREVAQHQLEPWTLAFDTDGTNIFSGGDDMAIQCILTPQLDDHQSEHAICVWKDRKTHTAGVTAILPLTESLIVTGSYDDHIRLLHRPLGRRPEVLAEVDLGGGVWRLKLLDTRVTDGTAVDGEAGNTVEQELQRYTFLASCMHAGTRIVVLVERRHVPQGKDQQSEVQWSFHVSAKFEEHKSMNYGSDVQPAQTGQHTRSIISTSFYDRLVCLWQFDMQNIE